MTQVYVQTIQIRYQINGLYLVSVLISQIFLWSPTYKINQLIGEMSCLISL